MPLSTATITLDIADILGNDFDSRRTKVWVTTNADYVIDTDGNQIRLGSGNVTVNTDGTAEAEVWIPGTGSNPASWQTTFHVDYPDRNARGGRAVESFGPFTITASADLADLVEEQAIPPDYAGELVAEMEALRDEAAAITGLTGEDEAVALLVETPSSDTATALADTVGAAIAAAAGPALADLAGFIVIGHRGAANIYPENSIEGYKGALATSLDVIEAGDLYLLADGGVAVMHDATVDRTTSSSGNVSSVTSAGLKRMRLDASAWFGGGWPDLEVPTFDDALTVLGGRALLAFEIKDSGASATASIGQIIAKVNGLGIAHSVVVSSSGLTELGVIIAGGLSGMYNVFTLSGVATPASLEAAGVEFAAIDISLLASGASWIADAQSRGIKVVGFTADHQGHYDACVAAGLDGMYSNDPVYASRDYATYRKTATTWHVNGTWGHGYAPAGSISGAGPWTVAQRGNFYGEAGAYRWRPTKAAFVNAGEVSPVANPTGTYTITAKIVFDSAFTSTSNGACLFVCSATDNPTNTAGNLNSSYLVKVRASGVINAWEITAAGAANSLGTGVTSTAPSFPVLSSGLTSGVAVTSLPVNALTVALKAGHQFILPTGQVATVSGAAAVGATAIPVNSITPSAAVASGSILLQQVTVTIAVTPTNVTIQRSDDPGTALVAANTNQRGGYIQIQNATFGDTGDVSFASLTIS